jgi:hypothetical protein
VLLDKCNLKKCHATGTELDSKRSNVRSRNAKVAEEVAWCRKRLQNGKVAMLGMEHAMKKSHNNMMAMMTSGSGKRGSGARSRVRILLSLTDIAKEKEDGKDLNGRPTKKCKMKQRQLGKGTGNKDDASTSVKGIISSMPKTDKQKCHKKRLKPLSAWRGGMPGRSARPRVLASSRWHQ